MGICGGNFFKISVCCGDRYLLCCVMVGLGKYLLGIGKLVCFIGCKWMRKNWNVVVLGKNLIVFVY